MSPEPPGVQISDYCEKTKTIYVPFARFLESPVSTKQINLNFLLTHTYPKIFDVRIPKNKTCE